MADFGYTSPPEAARAGEPRPAAEAIGGLAGRVEEIVRSEVRLAAGEIRAKAREAAVGGAAIAGGGIAALYAGGFVLVFAHRVLSKVFGKSMSALMLGAGLGVLSAAMFGEGIRTFKHINPKPERTIRSVKEEIRSAIGR